MAQSRLLDMMQSYTFWVFDATGYAGNPLFSIFTPEFGFSSCSLPEISIETKVIQPGNWEFKRKVVKSADVGPLMLQRGARFYDSDFYIWITNAIKGLQPVRRNLVVIQYLGFRLIRKLSRPEPGKSSVGAEVSLNTAGAYSGVAAQLGAFPVPLDRIPGRAWFCGGCIPTRYKPGDLDAKASDVSIMELEIQPEYMHELTVATISPIATRSFSLGLAIAEAAGATVV